MIPSVVDTVDLQSTYGSKITKAELLPNLVNFVMDMFHVWHHFKQVCMSRICLFVPSSAGAALILRTKIWTIHEMLLKITRQTGYYLNISAGAKLLTRLYEDAYFHLECRLMYLHISDIKKILFVTSELPQKLLVGLAGWNHLWK